MTKPQPDFTPQDFLPYLLNQAAEASSRAFQEYYRTRYGMLRTEWRVLFHLGGYGSMTAKDVCHYASIHKTKVSRAVKALEVKRFVTRTVMEHDRRNELLTVTPRGEQVYNDLTAAAKTYDNEIVQQFSADEIRIFRSCLNALAKLPSIPRSDSVGQ